MRNFFLRLPIALVVSGMPTVAFTNEEHADLPKARPEFVCFQGTMPADNSRLDAINTWSVPCSMLIPVPRNVPLPRPRPFESGQFDATPVNILPESQNN